MALVLAVPPVDPDANDPLFSGVWDISTIQITLFYIAGDKNAYTRCVLA